MSQWVCDNLTVFSKQFSDLAENWREDKIQVADYKNQIEISRTFWLRGLKMQKCIFDLDDRLSELILDRLMKIITHFFFGSYGLEYKVFEYVDKTFLRFLFKGLIR